jgi:hypothetical protein
MRRAIRELQRRTARPGPSAFRIGTVVDTGPVVVELGGDENQRIEPELLAGVTVSNDDRVLVAMAGSIAVLVGKLDL